MNYRILKTFSLFLAIFALASFGVVAQINTPAGAVVPFGANPNYAYGIMPTNLPTGGTYGKSQDAANAYIEWKANYVVSCGGSPERFRVKFDEPNRTVSEGIAYGMVLAAYAADKALFDGLWAYYKANSNGNGFLHWRIDGCSGVSGTNGATDADLDAAFALLVADTQWPSATSPYDYTTEATAQMNRIKQFEIHNSSYQAINGDGWGMGDNCRNPSYQSPAYYREFSTKNPGNAATWNNAVTAGYNLLNANAHATTGLVSDWCSNTGTRNTCNGSPLGVPTDGYGYDACRNTWRMAQDVIWNGSTTAASAASICTKIATYVNSKGAGNVRGPLYQDGNLYSGNQHNATFVSTFAMAIMGTTAANQTIMNNMYTETKNVKDVIQNQTLSGYFGNTLRCVSLFMMTGNFWKLGTTSLPEINVKGGALDIANNATFDFQNQQTIPPAGSGKLITFTIENKGFQTLNLTGTPRITITGAQASQFVLVQAVPATLSGNTTTTFTVEFRPTTTGTKNAVMTIASNDADEGSYVINLTGIGTSLTTSPNMTVRVNNVTYANSSTYAFGTITTSSTATALVYLKNTGTAPLNITSVTMGGSANFAKGTPQPTVVPINDSAAVIITFTPATAAAFTGTATIVTNDPSVPSFVLNLSGTGAACATVLASVPVLYNFDEYKNMTVGYVSTPVNPDTANKYVNAANLSAKVCSFRRGTAGAYSDQIRFTGCGNTISITAGKPLISMLVYSPIAGSTVLMNLKNDAGLAPPYASLYSAQATIAKANQWTRVYLDFTAAVGATGIKYLEIFIDPTNVNGVKYYYLDDIRYDSNPCTADVPASGILQDYDDHRNMALPWAPPGTFSEVAVNPNASGVNTSATVANYVRPNTGTPDATYQIIRYTTCGTLDLSAGKTIISMAIYSPKVGIPVTMSLKDGGLPNPTEVGNAKATTTKANQWEILYFDFSALVGNTTVKALDIFIDPLATSIATVGDRTYYIDDIRYAASLPCQVQIPATSIFKDFDANRYVDLAFNPVGPINEFAPNPSATGINTSATVASFVRPATALPDVIRYKSCGPNFLLTSGKSVVSLHVRSANANAEVIVSLKKANGTTELAQAYAKTTTANTWTELNFDFSDFIGSTEAAFMDIILDPNGTNIGTVAARTYYIDNIRYSDKPEINIRRGSTNVLNGDTIMFASTLIGDSIVVPLSMINNGAGDLLLNGTPALKLLGADAVHYYIIQSPSFSTTVTGGSAVGFSVVFKPTTVGTKISAIEIANNDGNENPYYVNLKGVATCSPVGAAGVITGVTTSCSAATGVTYSIAAVSGATGYTWTVPTGATITAGAGTNSITVTFGATSGNVTVTPINSCGSGTLASKAVTITTPPAIPGSITGTAAVCSGATGLTYSVATVAGATSYAWTVPTGATITAGGTTNSITVTMGSTAGNITVASVNSCGTSTASSQAITINTVPAAAGAITGSTAVCSGSTGNVYSITTVAGATGYTWTVPTGATITAGAGTTSITVTMGSTPGNVTVTPTNTCGSGTLATIGVTLTPLPAAAGTITGATAVCSGSTGNVYSITSVAGATGYTWTVPTGATITAGAGTTSITVTMGATAGNVTVTPTNACGNGTISTKTITISTVPATPGAITGATAVCSGSTGNIYSIANVAGATSYTWTVPTGATVSAGAGTNSITVTMGATAGNVTVTATNTCGTSSAASSAITINTVPSAAGAITGSTTVCSGQAGVTYSITTVAGATGYTWTVPTGATITAGAGTNSITVTMGSTAGNVTVTPTNTCGNGTLSSTAITISGAANPAGAITGTTTVCSGQTGVTYSIVAVAGATGYTWTVPTGATITAGAGTNSITVTFGTTSGNVTVTPTSACGNGASSNVSVTVNPAASAAGTITGAAAVCSGSTGNIFSITAVPGATGYTWTVPTGATITAGAGTTSITVTMGSTAGNVTVTPTSTCGNGTLSSKAITINTIPSAAGAISGSTTVCSGQAGVTYSITSVAGATGYNWTVPTGATITSGAGTNSITVTMGSTAGNVTVTPTNTCGNGTLSSAAITISGAANPAGVIAGSTVVCAGSTGNTYSIAVVPGATGYTWTVPTGATITAGAGTTSITVTFGSASGNVTVTPTSACGSGAASTAPITVNPAASAAGTIAGAAAVCSGSTGNVFSIASVAGATGYTWTVPTGATITAGAGTTSITVTMGSTAGNVTVTPTSTCGNGTLSSKAITINTVPSAAGAISGSTTVCSGQAGITYSIASVAGATGYNWTIPTGATITAGAGTNSITVTMGSTAGNVTVTPTNTCGNGTLSSAAITISGAANPAGAISGTNSVCSASTGNVYSIAAVAGATGYTWTVPTGATITAGAGTTSITVTFGSTSGNVTVTPTSACGSGAAASMAITVNGAVAAAGSITGNITPCVNATGIAYSIAAVPSATGYTWTVPSGATIASGAGTTSITVNFGTTSGNVTVTPLGTCGNGALASLSIALAALPTTANAGIDQSVCAASTTLAGNTPTVGTGTWSTVSGTATITAASSPTTTITGLGVGAITMRWTISNGSCASSFDDVLINVTGGITAANAGPDQSIVSPTSTATLAGNTPTLGTGTWTVISGTAVVTTASSPTSGVTGLVTGSATLRWTISNAGCTSSTDDVVLTVYALPPTKTISGPTSVVEGTSVTYSVTPPSNGSTYTWTLPPGTTIISSTPDNSSITVLVGPTSGNVSLAETNPAGTTTSTLPVTVSPSTGTNGATAADTYSAYPSPFDDVTTIRINSASDVAMKVRIMDSKGIVLYTTTEYATNQNILVGKGLSGGVYYVEVAYLDKIQVIKVIKM